MGVFECMTILTFLQALWASRVQGYAVSPPHPSITQAPAHNLLLQERQVTGDYVTCSQWTIPGFGVPVCNPGLTCIFQSDGNNEGCFPPAATEVAFTTNCYAYPTTWDGSGTTPINDVFCPFSAPACGEYIFSNAGGAWTNLGCSSTSYFITAYQIAAFSNAPLPTAAVTTVVITETPAPATSSTTPTTTPVPSTPSTTSTPSSTAPISTSSSASSTTTAPPQPTDTGNKASDAATIGGAVGGTVGGLGALIGGIAIWYYLRKKHALKAQQAAVERAMTKEEGSVGMQSPQLGNPYC
ncbi:Mucin-2 [Xylographa bjoerkii]|nr:Mucin-2 [Xylographa bjoerkii]